MSSHNTINSGTMSDSNDERYEQELVKQREEAKARLREEEEQQWVEQRARKEVRVVEKRRQEEELRRQAEEKRWQKEEVERQMKAEEKWRRQKKTNDVFHQEVDRQVAVIQVRQKNWLKKANPELLASPPSEGEMNLIDLPLLTKRQRVCYLLKETLEQRRKKEELVRELGIEPMGGETPCERCANFGILCLPQELP